MKFQEPELEKEVEEPEVDDSSETVDEVAEELGREAEECPDIEDEEIEVKDTYKAENTAEDDSEGCEDIEEGYCRLRESLKKLYGVRYESDEAPHPTKEAKIAILDVDFVLPREGDPQRELMIELL